MLGNNANLFHLEEWMNDDKVRRLHYNFFMDNIISRFTGVYLAPYTSLTPPIEKLNPTGKQPVVAVIHGISNSDVDDMINMRDNSSIIKEIESLKEKRDDLNKEISELESRINHMPC